MATPSTRMNFTMHGHQISDESIAMTVQHSYQVKEHGQHLERLGLALMQSQPAALEECQAIQAIGQQIQTHGQTAIDLITIAQQDRQQSTPAFVQAGIEHAKAIQLHVQANRILLRLNQSALPNYPTTAPTQNS
ncbi:hypothetical protein ACN4EK_01245 [Pantanalinema rosaneae CENA516]|uniref:hypothetical protein n=1 Tax=Pantanalinema rosaneae TaxID=1620701 RepID=UPI003D6F889E